MVQEITVDRGCRTGMELMNYDPAGALLPTHILEGTACKRIVRI